MPEPIHSLRVYIAGPMKLGDAALNVRMAIDAGDAVLRGGHCPYVPHLNHYWQMIHPHTTDEWMEQDRRWLLTCEALVRLPGACVGADTDVRWADALRIPVFYGVNAFLAWARQRRVSAPRVVFRERDN